MMGAMSPRGMALAAAKEKDDRAAAKAHAKELAAAFGHAPKKASGGKAAPRVKPGKGRRHGGYGI